MQRSTKGIIRNFEYGDTNENYQLGLLSENAVDILNDMKNGRNLEFDIFAVPAPSPTDQYEMFTVMLEEISRLQERVKRIELVAEGNSTELLPGGGEDPPPVRINNLDERLTRIELLLLYDESTELLPHGSSESYFEKTENLDQRLTVIENAIDANSLENLEGEESQSVQKTVKNCFHIPSQLCTIGKDNLENMLNHLLFNRAMLPGICLTALPGSITNPPTQAEVTSINDAVAELQNKMKFMSNK